MNQKTLIGLVAVAVVVVGAALAINHSRKPVSNSGVQAGMLVPALRDHVNDVSRLAFVGANKQPLVTLERGDAGWKVAQKGGYPADVGKLRDFMLKLADASLLEQKTANAARYADLGVTDVSDPAAAGVLVEIGGLSAPVQFIAGTFNAQAGGTFVRRADEPQSWLARGSLVPEKNATDWLRKELADIPSTRVASVAITRTDGKTLRIARQKQDDAQFVVADIPKGRELSSEYAANGLASVLADLRIEDVAPVSEVPPAADALKARYALFDGIVIDATSWLVGEKRYTAFKASLDAKVAGQYLAAQNAAAKSSKEDPESADAAHETKPAEADGKADAAKDEQSMATLEGEVARLNAGFDGWSFVLPAHKNANIDKSMDDLLQPQEAKSPGKGGKAGG